jgi:hypothetical protein
MSTDKPRSLLRLDYADAAEAYLRSLPPEHFMEAVPQATQRKISLESLDLVHAHSADVQVFNELLIQYPFGRHKRIRQVVPDNTVIRHAEPIEAVGSYDIPFQPVSPFWVMEYVSKGSKRKDYEDSYRKYERELKVPYCLLFDCDTQEARLVRHNGRGYVAVGPNSEGRLAIPELDLEVALLSGLVRFWLQGELLLLPAEMQKELSDARRRLRQAKERTRQAEERIRHAGERIQQAEARIRTANERIERARARLRELGIDPNE